MKDDNYRDNILNRKGDAVNDNGIGDGKAV